MINSVSLTGRLTKDVELKKTQTGKSVVMFTLAVDKQYKQEGKETADFIQCVAWNQSADFLSKYSHKGDCVGLHGRLQTRSYEGQNGKVYVTEVHSDVVCLLSKKDEPKQENVFEDEKYPWE